MNRRLLTSESVAQGHPDKLADQIADAILDALLAEDPCAQTSCAVLLKTGLCLLAGHVCSQAKVDFTEVARRTIAGAGYTRPELGFDSLGCAVVAAIERHAVPAPAVARPSGDPPMVFGFACDETKELMPLPTVLAHQLVRRLAELRCSHELAYLRPDGKSQVTVEYRDGKPARIEAVVVSAQHDPEIPTGRLRADILNHVVRAVIPAPMLDAGTKCYINATGRFVRGGPHADTGLSGRKPIVDTYGGAARYGGGVFSGRDPGTLYRSAGYMARHIAKNLVAAGLASRCEVQLAYAPAAADPVHLAIDTFGTGRVPGTLLAKMVWDLFVLRPSDIVGSLDLRRPIYEKTAAYGHFGRDESEFTWEKTDKASLLKSEAALLDRSAVAFPEAMAPGPAKPPRQ